MRHWRTASTAIVLAALAVCAAPAAHARQDVVKLNAFQMLQLYDRDRATAVANFGTNLHIDSVWDEIKANGQKWIKAGGPADAPRRRMLLATFLLEVIDRLAPRDLKFAAKPVERPGKGGGSFPPDPTVRRLLEWICDDIRSQHETQPLERVWHLALIAEYEHIVGKGILSDSYLDALAEHMVHAEKRLPAEPRWVLIRAWLAAHEKPPLPLVGPCGVALKSDHVWETCDAMFMDHSEEKYAKAMATPGVEAEARIEFAELHLKREHWDTVIQLTNEADGLTDDPELRYMSALLRGFAYNAKDDPRRAAASFQLALNAVPRAQTAAINLATALLLDGSPETVPTIVDSALSADVVDPWLFHRGGEYRHFPEYMATLRNGLK